MHKIGWGLFILACYCSTLLADQRRALEGFQGVGRSNAEAVANAKAQCFQWTERFSEMHVVLGTPDCGQCLCNMAKEPKCQCFGSIRFDHQFECTTKIRHRTIYHAAEGAAKYCGEAKFDASRNLYDWQTEESTNKFVVEFKRPECYCTNSSITQASAACRAAVTYLECLPS